LWSTVGFVAEIPSGALADRFGRRRAVVASSLFQAVGYVLWITLPGFWAFAGGFVLWGVGGALSSGAFEALLYDGLAEVGAEEHYARVNAPVNAVGLLSQVPAAVAASLLFTAGGYTLVGWVSIAVCLAASLVAGRLPEPAPPANPGDDGVSRTYFQTLRSGISEAVGHPAVRAAVAASAMVGGLDALEEYFPLVAQDWGVETAVIPVVVMAVFLAGAAGAAARGPANRLGPHTLAATLFGGLLVLTAAAVAAVPAGLAAVGVFYALHQMILVVVGARLQDRIAGGARATVTSAASLGTELVAVVLFAAWAAGGLIAVAGLWLAATLALPRWLRRPPA
jgi:MFS family permease